MNIDTADIKAIEEIVATVERTQRAKDAEASSPSSTPTPCGRRPTARS